MKFTKHEIKAILQDPRALGLAADWHQVQATMAAATGEDCIEFIKRHDGREASLRAEKKRMFDEGEWNQEGSEN